MKGLLLKDLINLRKYGRSVFFILAFFIVISLFTEDSGYLNGMVILMFTLMCITSFSYDDVAKWDVYALSLPVSRQQIVKSKYILSVLLAAAGAVLSIIIGGITALWEAEDFIEKLTITYGVFALAIVFICVLIPLIYKFGVEKSRIFMIAVFAIPTAAFMLLGKIGVSLPDKNLMILILSMSPALLTILLIASCSISCSIYSRKDL